MTRLLALAAMLAMVLGPGANAVSRPSHVAGELLVKFKPGPSASSLRSAVAVRGHAVVGELARPGWLRVRIAAGQTVAQSVAAYKSDPSVEHVQPNYIYRARRVPNDPRYGDLWAFANSGQTVNNTAGTAGADMNIERAWDHIIDCRSVVVAVVDSGMNYHHEDLAPNMWDGGSAFPRHGWDFIDNDNDPLDLEGHGTHVAGIIGAAGNNDAGVTGVCWQATLMAVRVLDETGSGTSATVSQGVDFAVANGAKVINMSLGGPGFDPLLGEAINNAQLQDVVVVAAAGNDSIDVDAFGGDYPCSFTNPNLICVTALDQNYALASFSNVGATSVDVGAPGRNILSLRHGAIANIADDFNTGNALDWTNTGGWAYHQASSSLVNPPNYPNGAYANSVDQRVYQSFDLAGVVSASVTFSLQHALGAGDVLNIAYSASGGDPFAGGVALAQFTGNGSVVPALDISNCATAACSFGFQLQTDASGTAQGVSITAFIIDVFRLTNSSYLFSSGTSMATPQVAGLAAMLRARHPSYRADDTVNAIRTSGRFVPGLQGVTTSGRGVDALAALAHIHPPTGLQFTVAR